MVKRIFAILGIIVLLCALASVDVIKQEKAFAEKSFDELEINFEATDHTASIVESKDYVFYAATDGIYRQEKSGTDLCTRIVKGEATALQLYNDTLYYLDSERTKLFSVGFDGKQKTKVYSLDEKFFIDKLPEYKVVENGVVFADKSTSVFYDKTIKKAKQIIPGRHGGILKFEVDNNEFYYIPAIKMGEQLYKTSLSEYEPQSVLPIIEKNSTITDFAIGGDNLYYLSNGYYDTIHKLDLSTLKITDITSTYKVYSMTTVDRDLYYLGDDNMIIEFYALTETKRLFGYVKNYDGGEIIYSTVPEIEFYYKTNKNGINYYDHNYIICDDDLTEVYRKAFEVDWHGDSFNYEGNKYKYGEVKTYPISNFDEAEKLGKEIYNQQYDDKILKQVHWYAPNNHWLLQYRDRECVILEIAGNDVFDGGGHIVINGDTGEIVAEETYG